MNAQRELLPQIPQTFSVGDWVWAKRKGTNNPRRLLARIENAQPLPGKRGPVWWVRIYRGKAAAQTRGWTKAPEPRYVDQPLNAAEVAHNRKLGLIPAAGEALP